MRRFAWGVIGLAACVMPANNPPPQYGYQQGPYGQQGQYGQQSSGGWPAGAGAPPQQPGSGGWPAGAGAPPQQPYPQQPYPQQPYPQQPYPQQPATAARVAQIEAWGHNDSTGTDVKWNSQYPHASFDDDPRRGGKPNAEWDGSHEIRGDRLCVRANNLRAPYPPTQTLSLGYTVTLDGATFSDGASRKTILVHRFSGTPQAGPYEVCEQLRGRGSIASTTPSSDGATQAQIEATFRDRIAQVRTKDDMRRMFDNLDQLTLVVGRHRFLLEPITRKWHFWDAMHGTWEPTGHGVGEVTFGEQGGHVIVTKRGAR
jgi:hypothetical protein